MVNLYFYGSVFYMMLMVGGALWALSILNESGEGLFSGLFHSWSGVFRLIICAFLMVTGWRCMNDRKGINADLDTIDQFMLAHRPSDQTETHPYGSQTDHDGGGIAQSPPATLAESSSSVL